MRVRESEEMKYSVIEGEEIKLMVREGGVGEYLLRIQEGCAHMTS